MSEQKFKSKFSNNEYWLKVAENWRKVEAPFRPSFNDLEIYESFLSRVLKNKKSPRILILGSTPRLRALAVKYTDNVTVVDININMMLAMTELMKIKNQKEIWVKANWVTAPLEHNYYDVILGDFVTTNVSWKEYKVWWKHLSDLLKPRGAFITRAFVALPKAEHIEILDKIMHRIMKKDSFNNKDYSEINVAIDIVDSDVKNKTARSTNKEMFFRVLEKYEISLKKKEKLYQGMAEVFPSTDKIWRMPTEEDVNKEVSLFFDILDKKSDNESIFKKTSPIYYLVKKEIDEILK
ncbi:MAG: methyltransferase domain-containing protein [Parcubacteria group bacterium]|nr:methyltransferase domain-containing protein [Parcubacteria group bacterium]